MDVDQDGVVTFDLLQVPAGAAWGWRTPDTPRHPPTPSSSSHSGYSSPCSPDQTPQPSECLRGRTVPVFPSFFGFFSAKRGSGGGWRCCGHPQPGHGAPLALCQRNAPLLASCTWLFWGEFLHFLCLFLLKEPGAGGDTRSQPISGPPPRHGCHHLSLPRSFPAPQSGIFCLPGAIMVVFLLCKLKIKKKRN